MSDANDAKDKNNSKDNCSDEKYPAVVLLSGGLDSATCLAIARSRQYVCYCLSINYGQRHLAELAAAAKIATEQGAFSHRIIDINIAQFGGSALTDATIDVPTSGIKPGIPATYVPARNTVMLALALSWAETLAAQDIFIGINAIDYSGYPDCRPQFVALFEKLANMATKAGIEGHKLRIQTPLINLTKADIIRRGMELGIDYAQTVSCYQADNQGWACGVCDACRLRKAGFIKAGIADPTLYQQNKAE